MLDQNITTLLAALIGGLLSVLGGFFANYYMQKSTGKIENDKSIRGIIEQIYRQTQNIHLIYMEIANRMFYIAEKEAKNQIKETEVKKCLSEINIRSKDLQRSLKEIELQINLHISPLQGAFLEYYKALEPLILVVEEDYPTDVDKNYPYPMLEDGDIAQEFWRADKQFQSSLAKFLKSKGYGYL